jgi:hypothetical protein
MGNPFEPEGNPIENILCHPIRSIRTARETMPVRKAQVDRFGVLSSMLTAKGYGEKEPLVPNDTVPTGRRTGGWSLSCSRNRPRRSPAGAGRNPFPSRRGEKAAWGPALQNPRGLFVGRFGTPDEGNSFKGAGSNLICYGWKGERIHDRAAERLVGPIVVSASRFLFLAVCRNRPDIDRFISVGSQNPQSVPLL